jgi:hypothetical protein
MRLRGVVAFRGGSQCAPEIAPDSPALIGPQEFVVVIGINLDPHRLRGRILGDRSA